MAFSKSTILPLFLVFVLVANKVVSQGDSTSFAFDSFSRNMDNLTFQYHAFVPSSSSFVRLTGVDSRNNPMDYSIGRVVYSPLVNFWDEGLQASFQTTIRFLITPSNTVPGDGITFFIAPPYSQIPGSSYGGNFGIFETFTGTAPSLFAVEFDLASNSWDPTYPHIGIDINSRVSRNVSRFENSVGQEVTARINYVSNTRTITVVATYGSETSTLSYVFDLKTILPKQVQVGVSAGTGAWVAYHDLHSWYFDSTLIWDAPTNSDQKDNIRQYV